MLPLGANCRSQAAVAGMSLMLVAAWALPAAKAQAQLMSSAQGLSCETGASEAPMAQPRRSLWALALRNVGVTTGESTKDAQLAALRAACSRTKLDGCSSLSPRPPDSSWASPQSYKGLPETLRPKAAPCVDTWYRLVGRRDGWVHFDVIRTDRRPARVDPRWMTPLRMEVSCAALRSKVGEVQVPIRPGSLGWVGAEIFC